MAMQKVVIFVKKNWKINMPKIKKVPKIRDHYHYTVEYRGAAYSICNLKYGIPKEILIVYNILTIYLFRREY